jgi:ABC-type sulfate/molybdate transport systems ATPase subunit
MTTLSAVAPVAAALAAHIVVERPAFTLDVSVDAAAGEIVSIMGPSGAGKSTLLEALAGLVRLDDGFVRLDADEVASASVHIPPQRRGVVLLGQDPRLFPHLSARDNVAFGLRAHGIAKADARAVADDLLERVGLASTGDRAPGSLSGGQQQRVALARALAVRPRLLLLDEPLTSLDVEIAADMRVLMRELLESATALVVSHDASDAVALAHRLVVVERGRVAQRGTVEEVLGAPASRFVAAVAAAHRFEAGSDDRRGDETGPWPL